jgi:GNAT superfamily N-acetyltransferase
MQVVKLMFSLGYHLRRVGRFFYFKDEWVAVEYDLSAERIYDQGLLPVGYLFENLDASTLLYESNHHRNNRVSDRRNHPDEVGFALSFEGYLVYDTWVYLGSYRDPNTGILSDPLANGAVLLDSYTAPHHRGHGLHRKMVCERLKWAKSHGIVRVVGLVHKKNVAALKAQKANGARAVTEYCLLTVLGFRRQSEKML